MNRTITTGFLAVLSGSIVPAASACDYLTMRDAGFDEPRDVHRLCVIGKSDDASSRKLFDDLAGWLETSAAGLNLEPVFLAADDPAVNWTDYGIPSAPPAMPVVALIGRQTMPPKGWVIDHWEPGPTTSDLEQLASSPAREAIRKELGRKLAVLLHVPAAEKGTVPISRADAQLPDRSESEADIVSARNGDSPRAQNGDSPQPGEVRRVIDAVAETWAAKQDEWLGTSVVRADRSDPRERLLMRFAGVKPEGPDWVAVVFGRGKFMAPLEGDEITEAALNSQLEVLIGECTCMRSPRSLGVDVPLIWTKALDEAVVRLKTPEDEIAGGEAETAVAMVDSTPPAGGLVLTRSVWTLAGLAAGVIIIGAALVLRKNRAA